MKIKPLFDRVLAKPIKENTTTKSGISLSFTNDTNVKKAKVVSVGTGIFEDGTFIKMHLKENDVFYYEEHTVCKMFIENVEHILIKQTDILAIEELN